MKRVKFAIFRHFLENTSEEWHGIWYFDIFWLPTELISFWAWPVDFPHFGIILTKWNSSNLGFREIFFRTHGRNGLKFDMLMYADHFWNSLHFDDRLLNFLVSAAFWQARLAVSRHLLENAWEEWAAICHAYVSWPPSELIRFWSKSDATAVRSPDLLVHLCLVISEEIKKANFSI